jgi:hypothetical protein
VLQLQMVNRPRIPAGSITRQWKRLDATSTLRRINDTRTRSQQPTIKETVKVI